MEPKEALKAPMTYCRDFEGITIGEYLRNLLVTLLIEEESFSGKRPFGNSGWSLDLKNSLIDCGYLPKSPYNTKKRKEADAKIRELVYEAFRPYERY